MAKRNSGIIKHDHEKAAEIALAGEEVREVLREKRLENIQVEQKMKSLSILRELLRTPIIIQNYTVHEFKAMSQNNTDWVVSYFFPVAKNEKGETVPTYVDSPLNDRQRAVCEKKAEIMRGLGRRYIVVENNNHLTSEQIRRDLSESLSNDSHVEVL